MTKPKPIFVLCNGSSPKLPRNAKKLQLDYRPQSRQLVRLSLPNFVRNIPHISPRILDLLEITAYVYAADRLAGRGAPSSLEYHNWSRSFRFHIRVRDEQFWSDPTVISILNDTLCFMSGDREYTFCFEGGHSTPATNLFDRSDFQIARENTGIALFSGGLDSLAGAVQLLTANNQQLCLVSHQSGQPTIKRTQRQLVNALQSRFPDRISHYRFDCGLTDVAAEEESQRTRSFLYNSIAYALSHAYGVYEFYVFENGITSLNFPKRGDVINARASRTTHPKTMLLLTKLFTMVGGRSVKIHTPFDSITKTEVFGILKKCEVTNLINSTVSCSRTREKHGISATHCGFCSQCLDRRFAAYAADMDTLDDAGIYSIDIISSGLEAQQKGAIVDYIRLARKFADYNLDEFYTSCLAQLTDIVGYKPGIAEDEVVRDLWELCMRHGQQIKQALWKIKTVHDDPFLAVPENGLLKLLSDREFLKDPVDQLAFDISARLRRSLPIAFQSQRPVNENHLNDHISAILNAAAPEFQRDAPGITFGLTKVIPDHSNTDLLVETKYIRDGTPPSKASDGIAADLTKRPTSSWMLFVVYDPDRMIVDDEKFRSAFETKGHCRVLVVR